MSRRWSQADIAQLVALRAEGMSYDAIGLRINRGHKAIKDMVRTLRDAGTITDAEHENAVLLARKNMVAQTVARRNDEIEQWRPLMVTRDWRDREIIEADYGAPYGTKLYLAADESDEARWRGNPRSKEYRRPDQGYGRSEMVTVPGIGSGRHVQPARVRL